MMISTVVCLLALGSSDTVYVAMKQRNLDVLHDVVMNMSDYTNPNYGQYWSKDQVLDLVAPTSKELKYVEGVMALQHYVCDSSFRDALNCTGNTTAYPLDAKDPKFRGLVSLFISYDGSDIRSRSHVQPRTSFQPVIDLDSTPDVGYFGRESMHKLYNFTSSASGLGQSVCAAEYFGMTGYDQNNMYDSQTFNGQERNPVAHVVGQNQGSSTETELDLQMESQTADKANVWYWNNNNQWLYAWALGFFNTKDVPSVVSHSWGWAVDKQCQSGLAGCVNATQYVERVDAEYLKIAARGVTLTASSGDAGAPGRTNEGCDASRPVTTIFPSSSPYVLSVGATYVVNNGPLVSGWSTPLCTNYTCTTGTQEHTTYYNATGWTAGGGFSTLSNGVTPTWQLKAVKGYLDQKLPMPSSYNPNGRVIPDISAVGHNCPTWIGQDLEDVDGTSCSSPIIAGVVAMLNRHQALRGRPNVGMVAPLLYAMYYDDPTIFNDVTSGVNWCTEVECCPTRADGGSDYGYSSAKGYDPVTGLGTPNLGRMLNWLDLNT